MLKGAVTLVRGNSDAKVFWVTTPPLFRKEKVVDAREKVDRISGHCEEF